MPTEPRHGPRICEVVWLKVVADARGNVSRCHRTGRRYCDPASVPDDLVGKLSSMNPSTIGPLVFGCV